MNAINQVRIEFAMVITPDDDARPDQPNASNYAGCSPSEIDEYMAQDRKRVETFYDDEWHYNVIKARVTIVVTRGGFTTGYTMESAGLGFIESDSDDAYIKSVYDDECESLRADLQLIQQMGDFT